MNSRALPLLALILAVGIFFAYVRPTWQGPIAAAKASIATTDAALKAAEDYRARENKLAKERAAIDPANLARISLFLPDTVDNVRIILDLSALAARSSLTLTSIDVASTDSASASSAASSQPVTASAAPAPVAGSPVPGGVPGGGALPTSNRPSPVGSVDLSLTVVGTYSAFQTFLEAIEKSARLLDVKELAVKGSDTGVYAYQLSVRLYWLR